MPKCAVTFAQLCSNMCVNAPHQLWCCDLCCADVLGCVVRLCHLLVGFGHLHCPDTCVVELWHVRCALTLALLCFDICVFVLWHVRCCALTCALLCFDMCIVVLWHVRCCTLTCALLCFDKCVVVLWHVYCWAFKCVFLCCALLCREMCIVVLWRAMCGWARHLLGWAIESLSIKSVVAVTSVLLSQHTAVLVLLCTFWFFACLYGHAVVPVARPLGRHGHGAARFVALPMMPSLSGVTAGPFCLPCCVVKPVVVLLYICEAALWSSAFVPT